MIQDDFASLQELKPSAFKLYVYLLNRADVTGSDAVTMPLADLAQNSGLQVVKAWQSEKHHGSDGKVRRAIHELIVHGYIAQSGRGRGPTPNTYHILRRGEGDD